MADLTDHFSLFLPPKANNAGDPAKPLSQNFVLIDSILWKVRTNYQGDTPESVPVGGFLFDSVSEKLYYRVSSGLKEVGSGGVSGGGSITIEDILPLLYGQITQDELSSDLNQRITDIDLHIDEAIGAKDAAVDASIAALQAKTDAILAANQASGFKVDAYNWSETSKTQAALASGFAVTATTKANEAVSSAGAAGESAQSSENSKIQAGLYNSSAQQAADAAAISETNALSYKTAAETAAQSAYDFSVNALIGAQESSGYANSAFEYSQTASSKAGEAGEYAIAAQTASGLAETSAGKAEALMIQMASASGDIIEAADAATLSAESASGYAESSRLYSASSSGYAQDARESAELVASYLGNAEVSGYIGVEAEARASADAALSQRIDTLSTTVGQNTTTIQTQQSSIDGIKGTYSVKINNNGYVAGFGLTSSLASGGNGAYSSFVVLADRFAVVKPLAGISETPTQIFVVDTETGAVGINGSLVAGQIYSRNWAANKGSLIDLNAGSLVLGGWDNPNLVIDENGILHASGAEISGKVTISDGSTGFHNLIDRPMFKGEWSPASIEYKLGDEVAFNGSTWSSLITHISDVAKSPPVLPITSNTYWSVRSQKGEQGEAYVVIIESSNGNIFRPGYSTSTTLIAHVFLNGEEVTDSIDSSRFKWRRVSSIPQDPPNDDNTWNTLYQQGYKQVLITTDSIYARATYNCDIVSY